MPQVQDISSLLEFVARRLRVQRFARAILCTVGAALLALVVYQILYLLVTSAPVLTAVRAILLIGGITAALVIIARGLSPVSVEDAAVQADRVGDLKDEIKTAHWFTRHPQTGDLPALQMARAAATARRVTPSTVVPGLIPRGTWVLVALAGISAFLWSLQGLRVSDNSAPAQDVGAAAQRQATTANAAAVATDKEAPSGAAEDAADSAKQKFNSTKSKTAANQSPNREAAGHGDGAQATWEQLEQALRAYADGPEGDAVRAAIAARDPKRAAALLRSLQRQRDFADAMPVPPTTPLQPVAAAGAELVDRMKALFDLGGSNTPSAAKSGDPLDEDAVAQQTNPRAGAAPNDTPQHEAGNNAIDGAVPLEAYGQRMVRNGEEGGDPAATSSSAGGALGRRVSRTKAGAGGSPGGSDTAKSQENDEAQAVLGQRTTRLAAQLQRVNIDSKPASDAAGIVDPVYAATRAQQSTLEYSTVGARPRYSAASSMTGEQVPLAYRGQVRDYFLNLQSKEQ